jgi:hypothetical protein
MAKKRCHEKERFTDMIAVRFEQVMLTLRRIVAQVEEKLELCVHAALMHSQRGELEESRTSNDLEILMQGLMCMGQSLGPTPSSPGPLSISSMTLDMPPAPPNDRTIGFAAGTDKFRAWLRF